MEPVLSAAADPKPDTPPQKPTAEEMALLLGKLGELTEGLHRMEENYQKLQSLEIKPEIEGGTKNG